MTRATSSADRSCWQAASLLLGYPDEVLYARLPLLHDVASRLPRTRGEPLLRFLGHLCATPVLAMAEHYVATFDHLRRCCPYLTYYAHGDTRRRGVALLAFKNAYRRAGLELAPDELPDHLAVVLEFAGFGPGDAGRQLLIDHRAGIELLRLGLADVDSPYSDVLRAVCATLPALSGGDREAVARLAAEGPPAEEVGLAPFALPSDVPSVEGAPR